MKHLNQVITQPTTTVMGYGVWPTEWEKGMVSIEYFLEPGMKMTVIPKRPLFYAEMFCHTFCHTKLTVTSDYFINGHFELTEVIMEIRKFTTK